MTIVLSVCVVIAVWYILDPTGPALTPFLVSMLLFGLTCAFGPYFRGARPVRVWIFETVGCLFFIVSFNSPRTFAEVGAFEGGGFFYLAGYACICVWLIAITYTTARTVALRQVLDTTAATAAALVVLWTIAGRVDGSGFQTALTWAIFPVLDVALVALVAHLVVRQGDRLPAWRWLLAAWILQLTLDTLYALAGLRGMSTESPVLTVGYMLTYWLLAMAATHPSISDLEQVSAESRGTGQRGIVALITAIALTVASTTLPVTDPVGSVVRTVLVTVVLVVLSARLLLTMRDLRRSEAESAYRAVHDPLTELPNRHALLSRLGERLDALNACAEDTPGTSEEAAPPTNPCGTVALLSIDCDDFKRVNDTWGHAAGDRMLREIGTRLEKRLPDRAMLARHGGDEFFILAGVDTEEQACQIAQLVQDFFTEPLPVMGHRQYTLSASIGIALAGADDHASVEQLMREADVALYAAKSRGRGRYAVFDDDLDEISMVQNRIAEALPGAVAGDGIVAHLQPILTGPGYRTVAGWEALARWHDPLLGQVSPLDFIPAAERLGLIEDLGEAVLRRACTEATRLREHLHLPDAIVTVNVSALQLHQPEFADIVADALAQSGLPGHCLWLEITESLLVDSGEQVLATLDRLRELGVLLCIDDFGTGYASLDVLVRLPIDAVKIDRELTGHLVERSDGVAALDALMHLMRALGIAYIVAEGVETAEQEAALAASGVPMVQGWLYGAGAPASDHLARHATAGLHAR